VAAASARQRRLRGVLVAGENRLSLVLLVAAGLTVRSFIQVQRVSSGFNPEQVLTVGIAPGSTRYTPAQRAEFWEQVVRAVGQVPGVQRAAAISRLPLLPGNSTRGLPSRMCRPTFSRLRTIERRRLTTFGDGHSAAARADGSRTAIAKDGRRVAIISSSMAQRYWTGRDPIGQHFQIDVPARSTPSWASSATSRRVARARAAADVVRALPSGRLSIDGHRRENAGGCSIDDQRHPRPPSGRSTRISRWERC
jgi:hypothetical protein